MNRQLALSVGLSDHAAFATFLDGDNALARRMVEALASGDERGAAWLCGPSGAGKSHLLQAACARASMRGAVVYLPLARLGDTGPGVLEGLEACRLVCIDDLDLAAGDARWEHALFALCNALGDAGVPLAMAARVAPAGVGFELADLRSRLSASTVLRLALLDDDGLVEALALRARRRGLELPAPTGYWLLRRLPRDPPTLFELLDRLDHAALAAQRRLTIPFVRETLAALARDQRPD